MPKTDWEIELFPYGEIWAERVDFSIDGHGFLMVFTPMSEISDEETLAKKSEEMGFIIPDNSYDVKFDRTENFESGDFYAPSSSKMDMSQLNRLGLGIRQIMEFHYSMKNTEAYFATAENRRLAQYYDRLARTYAEQLQFEVMARIGEEGLDYAIRTPKYKGKKKEDRRHA